MLKYIIAFFLGYFILSRLFGTRLVIRKTVYRDKKEPVMEEKPKFTSSRQPEKGGDYIDYEEIK